MNVSIRDLIVALALGTIVYRWAIADNTESRGDDAQAPLRAVQPAQEKVPTE